MKLTRYARIMKRHKRRVADLTGPHEVFYAANTIKCCALSQTLAAIQQALYVLCM